MNKKSFSYTLILFLLFFIIGCGKSDINKQQPSVTTAKTKLIQIPEWFEIDKKITTDKAKQLIKAFQVSQEFKFKYAEAYMILENYEMAGKVYLELYKSSLARGGSILKQDNILSELLGPLHLMSAYNNFAKATYLILETNPNLPIKILYTLHKQVSGMIGSLRLHSTRDDAVVYEFSTMEQSKDIVGIYIEDGLTKEGHARLIQVRDIIEERMKTMGYSLEDF